MSQEVFSTLEGVYSGTQFLGKKGGIRKCERSISGIQRKNRGGSKKTGEDRQSGGKRFQKGRATREVYGKNIVWVGQWKI